MPALNTIETKVQQGADAVVRQMVDEDDAIARAVIGRNTQKYLVINSSFLYRDVKTAQSNRRLIARLTTSANRVRSDRISIIDNEPLKAHNKIVGAEAQLVSLPTAIHQEIASMGNLVFVLIGSIKGLRTCSQRVKSTRITEIRLVPSQTGAPVQTTGNGVYSIATLVPIEDLFEHINEELDEGLSIQERQALVSAYDDMLDAAITEVTVPTTAVRRRQDTILGKIAVSVREQVSSYRTALDTLLAAPEDRMALNEVLRIAYNFSVDALPLLSLFVSVCDLKPLVFWCTVKEQWALHRAFSSLPWGALGRKEKLEEYKSLVSQARSYAFHHFLPFESTVEIDLTGLNVQARTIRLFLPFGQKSGRGFHIEDQELADVLVEFSRPKQRPVSEAFWRANLSVMECALKLTEEIVSSLILIHEARLENERDT